MFLDLTLYNTSTPRTLFPKSITWSTGVNSRPKVFSTPVSSNVCVIVFNNSVVVVVISLCPFPVKCSTSEFSDKTTESVISSPTNVALSRPFQVCSWEFQKLEAIPPFSRCSSSTPSSSANALYAVSILKMSGAPRGTSSIQKSVSGFNSIDPA